MITWTKLTREERLTIAIDAQLRNDYEQMKLGFIYKDAPTYEYLMEKLVELQHRFRNLEWSK